MGLFGALPARQPTQRQANSTLHKQMLQKATASAAVAGAALVATASPAVPSPLLHPSLAPMGPTPTSPNPDACNVRVTENAADQATPSTERAAHRLAVGGAAVAAPSGAVGPVATDVAAQQVGCGDDCLNRLSFIHCDPKLCPCGDCCSNRYVACHCHTALRAVRHQLGNHYPVGQRQCEISDAICQLCLLLASPCTCPAYAP